MLKDETRCIRCGLCAMRCPVGIITMESYSLLPAEPTGLISIAAIGAGLQRRSPTLNVAKGATFRMGQA